MNEKRIIERLREILKKDDLDTDGVINRKTSKHHDNQIDTLLDNISLLVTYLRFDAESTRREMSEIRRLLEE